MTITEIVDQLIDEGYRCAYDHFTEAVKLPFVIVLDDGTDNIFADNRVYRRRANVVIELYTRQSHQAEFEKFEQALEDIGLNWQCDSRSWIDDEKVMDSRYSISGY